MKHLNITLILVLFIATNTSIAQQCFQRVVKKISHSELNEQMERELRYQNRKAQHQFLYFTDSLAYSRRFLLFSAEPTLSNISGDKIYERTEASENGGLPFKNIGLEELLETRSYVPPSWSLTGRKKTIAGYLCEEIEIQTESNYFLEQFYWVARALPNHEFIKTTTPVYGMVLETVIHVQDSVGGQKGSVTIEYEIKEVAQPEEFTFAINEVNKMVNFKQERGDLLSDNEMIDSDILRAIDAIPNESKNKKLVINEELVPHNKTKIKTKTTYRNNHKTKWLELSEDGTKRFEIDYRYSPLDTTFLSIDTIDLARSINGAYVYKYYQDTLCKVFAKKPGYDQCWLLIEEEKVRESFKRVNNTMIPKIDYYYDENLLLTRMYFHESGGEMLYEYNQRGQQVSLLELPRNRKTIFEYYPNGLRSKECGASGCYLKEYELDANIDGSFTFAKITTKPDGKEMKLIQQYDARHSLIQEIKIDIEGKRSEERFEIEYY